ncbi:alpha-E domain-containing protein [Sphingomonas sp. ID0503]|uniref:alpha-E domain-containing protein n=1 Tax=Sphingomonas sp. ID0503 TaxID=3399691 RepID=UPI003AFB685E
MLSRTASSLYWMGRYMERAEFTAQLVEATLRLDALSPRPAGAEAWASALHVASSDLGFQATGDPLSPLSVNRYLTLARENPSSIRSCIEAARTNARAVRTALTREAWLAINRAWMGLRDRSSPGGAQATLALVEDVKAEARGFEGALHRMLRNEANYFISLGQAIERSDNTARLLDVKYHLLLPEGEQVGGTVDRDQWTAILQTVSAVTAYRWLYREGLQPWLVAELLILRPEMPRSLVASAEHIVSLLNRLSQRLGRQGEADRLAKARHTRLRQATTDGVFQSGLHEFLQAHVARNAELDAAIVQQFRFS